MTDPDNAPQQSAGLTTQSVAGTTTPPAAPAQPDPQPQQAADPGNAPVEAAAAVEDPTPDDAPEEMAVPRLDMSRDKAQIMGQMRGECGKMAGWKQNGQFFTAQGEWIPSLTEPMPVQRAMPHQKVEVRTLQQDAAPPATLAQQGDVNLQDWYDGTAQYRWVDVRVAVKSAVGQTPQNKVEAQNLLREHGVIGLDDHNE